MYDIFRGKDHKVVWLETVSDFMTATEHMRQHAARIPGRYLVFSKRRGCVVSELETFTETMKRAEDKFDTRR